MQSRLIGINIIHLYLSIEVLMETKKKKKIENVELQLLFHVLKINILGRFLYKQVPVSIGSLQRQLIDEQQDCLYQ